MILLTPLLALTISCILGFVIALVATRIRNKSLITVVLTLGFIGLYVYGYSQISRYLQLLLANSETVAETVKEVLYPLYQMGLAAKGNVISL